MCPSPLGVDQDCASRRNPRGGCCQACWGAGTRTPDRGAGRALLTITARAAGPADPQPCTAVAHSRECRRPALV